MPLSRADEDMLEISVGVLAEAFYDVRAITLERAVMDMSTHNYYRGKTLKDTLGLDSVAEQKIAGGSLAAIRNVYGRLGTVITEEAGRLGESFISPATPVVFSDPFDGSKFTDNIIRTHPDCSTLGEVFDRVLAENGTSFSRIAAPTTSMTLVKDGELKFSLVANFFTGELFVASEKGVISGDIYSAGGGYPPGNQLQFRGGSGESMVCYCGRDIYLQNLSATGLGSMFHLEPFIFFCGGPSRFTYLLMGAEVFYPDVGIIAHNGEPLQEAIPNMAIAAFSGGRLRAYKITRECDRHDDEGCKLTPPVEESIYKGLLAKTRLDLSVLSRIEYPSEYSDTTVIVPSGNEGAIGKLEMAVSQGYAMRLV